MRLKNKVAIVTGGEKESAERFLWLSPLRELP